MSHALVSIAPNLAALQATHSPTVSGCQLVEDQILQDRLWPAVPVVTVCLNDKPFRLEDKIWLKATEHRFVHDEDEPERGELLIERSLNRGHFGWERLTEARFTDLRARSLSHWPTKRADVIKLLSPRVRVEAGTCLKAGDHLGAFLGSLPDEPGTTGISAEYSALDRTNRTGDLGATGLAGQYNALPSESVLGSTLQRTESRPPIRHINYEVGTAILACDALACVAPSGRMTMRFESRSTTIAGPWLKSAGHIRMPEIPCRLFRRLLAGIRAVASTRRSLKLGTARGTTFTEILHASIVPFIELKESYHRQALKNAAKAKETVASSRVPVLDLFSSLAEAVS